MARNISELKGTLADGAERLERIVRAVKDRQFSETRNTPVLKPVSDAFALSPEEIWSKKYMTAGIGPSNLSGPQLPELSTMFQPGAQPFAASKLQPALAHSPAGTLRPASIGRALAKPARRRSWLGRLVRGG